MEASGLSPSKLLAIALLVIALLVIALLYARCCAPPDSDAPDEPASE